MCLSRHDTGMNLPTQHLFTATGNADELKHLLYYGIYPVIDSISSSIRVCISPITHKPSYKISAPKYIINVAYYNADEHLLDLYETRFHQRLLNSNAKVLSQSQPK
jgi:hypothetical protein